MKPVVVLLALSLISGCASLGSNLEDDLVQAPPPPGSLVSKPILIIADNQQAMEYRQGNFETSLGLRGLTNIPSVVRPRALTLWSNEIIDKITSIEKDAKVLLHLGDIMNNSCLSEWEEVRKKFDLIRKDAWYLTPGNHDGYYFGLSHPLPEDSGYGPLDEYLGWGASCVPLNERIVDGRFGVQNVNNEIRSTQIVNKSDFIELYLEELAGRGVSLPDEYCDAVDHAILRGICFKRNNTHPWKSFIVQHLVIEKSGEIPVHIVITDTSSFEYQPKLLNWFPKHAHGPVNLTDSVINATSRFLENIGPGNFVVLAGHHPFKKFKDGRDEVLKLWHDGLFDIYLSGDTHDGLVKRHGAYSSSKGLLEVNMGSVLDPPVEYRTLRLYKTPSDHYGFQMKRTFLTPPSNRDRDGFVRLPPVSPIFEECLRKYDFSLIKSLSSPKASRFNSLIEASYDLAEGKGFETRRDILVNEAHLYQETSDLFNLEVNWSEISNPVSDTGGQCGLNYAESLKDSLDMLTSDSLNNCWPRQQGQKTVVLAQMSKILSESSIALDTAIASSPQKSNIHEYKVCAALVSSHNAF